MHLQLPYLLSLSLAPNVRAALQSAVPHVGFKKVSLCCSPSMEEEGQKYTE